MIKINVKLVQDYLKPVTNVQLVNATWFELWTRNASAPTTLELTQGGKEEASGSDRKAFCFSQWQCCPVSSCTLPCCFSECYVALTVELCALTFRHRDCPALHCTARHFRAVDEDRTTALPRLRKTLLLPGAPRGTWGVLPWPSRSQPHSGVNFLLQRLFGWIHCWKTCQPSTKDLTEGFYILNPFWINFSYGCHEWLKSIKITRKGTIAMTLWWQHQNDIRDTVAGDVISGGVEGSGVGRHLRASPENWPTGGWGG